MRLDEWLNGGVFPIKLSGKYAPEQEHLRRVAATFMGDQPIGDNQWQLHLDFKAYDFSYIPIETLSVVYEQFLHAPLPDSTQTAGRKAGAYYTPIPVVNFMLAEMEDRRPLRKGMRILDPSCGSGAFLVQCYRRLIEQEFPADGPSPGPIKLRTLLQAHIFGIDQDDDACSVSELSLILTLLDYVNPPDLENDRRVKLPSLRGTNIFCENFFASNAKWHSLILRRKFDWVIGNPPWKKLIPARLTKQDEPVWKWMVKTRAAGRPIGDNQVAQAFVWGAHECLDTSGQAGVLIPAMTLFEAPSSHFRAALLRECRLQSVANFSNLAEVLFAGRARVPAAAVFFQPHGKTKKLSTNERIATYAPLVANQEPTRPVVEHTRQETWSLVLNASEVRDIPLEKVITGSGLPWKLAMWGSEFDEKLIRRLAREFTTLRDLEKKGVLICSEGLQLRNGDSGEAVERVSEVTGKQKLNVDALKEMRHFFCFPPTALEVVSASMSFARKGRAKLPLSICCAPHVVIGAARTFAIYTDDFLVVPARQVGIRSTTDDKNLLIALSLFLSSDFAFYHQFLTATQFGVQRGLATLNALREMPIPVDALKADSSIQWKTLHEQLVQASISEFNTHPGTLFSEPEPATTKGQLVEELNNLTSKALGLTDLEQALIHDLVKIKLELNDGKLGRRATGPPDTNDVERYARQLKGDLDNFTVEELAGTHNVQILIDDQSALVIVDFVDATESQPIRIFKASQDEAAELSKIRAKLRREQAQWVYFDRNLRILEGTRVMILKPNQRFHWTVSQAASDASDLIAEGISAQGDSP